MKKVMTVKCIKERETFPDQFKVDDIYYVDVDSIYMAIDGDVLGIIYHDKLLTEKIGGFNLNYFCTVCVEERKDYMVQVILQPDIDFKGANGRRYIYMETTAYNKEEAENSVIGYLKPLMKDKVQITCIVNE